MIIAFMCPRPFVLLWLNFAVTASLVAAESPEIAVLRDKALHGNAIAEYNLGISLAHGVGTAVNLPEAYAWLALAAENGTAGKALENLLAVLTPDQLAAGQRRLEEIRGQISQSRPLNFTPAAPRSGVPHFSRPAFESPVEPTKAPSLPAERALPEPTPTPARAPAAGTSLAAEPASAREVAELRTQVAILSAALARLQGEIERLQAEARPKR